MSLLAPTAQRLKPAGAGLGVRWRSVLSTAGLARLSALHPWRAIAVWVVILALAGVAARGLADALTTEVEMTTTPDSVRALDLLEARLRPYDPVTETVLVTSDSLTVDDPAFQRIVTQTAAGLRELTGVVDPDPTRTYTYYEVQASDPAAAEALVSADRRTTMIPVTLVGTFGEATDHADALMATIGRQGAAGIDVLTVGAVSSDHTYGVMAEEDLRTGEGIGLTVALVVLAVVFGALVAPVLPLALAFVAILVAFGLSALVGRALDLSTVVPNIITMLGMAVGIDYSLFIVARYREERRRGASKLAAIELAGGTASKAVFFSGTTVVLALLGMFFVPLTIFRSIGTAAILVVVAAVLATLTLVPALLSLLGDRIDWPRKWKGQRPAAVMNRVNGAPDGGFWSRVTHAVMARPIVSAGLAIVLLVGLALPAFDLRRGMSGISSLPESDVKRAYELLAANFTVGRLEPVEIVVDGRRDDPAVIAGIERLSATMAEDAAFGQRPTVEWNAAGDLALVQGNLTMDAGSSAAYDTVDRLRATTIPTAFTGVAGAEVLVTGGTAMMGDFFDAIDAVTPWVFAFVLGLSFLLLTLAFRSLVVPIKAIIMNLLSVGAAYGMLVLVFEKGYGADLLGFQRTEKIEAWLPIFLFCILFGLSMDYHVFLLSRIREHYDLTGNNRASVAVGLQTTAKIITGAALIMVVVFSGFAAGRLVMLQEMGFGLAVAVFLDATIVRSVLVPATMALLGDWNWYLPKWLRWLPDLRIESAPAAWP